jgi:hypothetical protein
MSQVAFIDRMVMSQNYDKSSLKLDLEGKASNNSRKRKLFHSPAAAGLLQSPDLKLLKIASPELEKIIINNNGFIPTGYTPMTPGTCSFIPTGENSAEDQESFARGFIEALQKLQEQDVPAPSPPTETSTRNEAIATTKSTTTTSNPARWQADNNRNSVPVITNRYDRPTPPVTARHTPTPPPPPTISNFSQTSQSTVTSMGITSIPHANTYINRPEIPLKSSLQTSSISSGITLPTPISSGSSIPTTIDTTSIKSEEDHDEEDDLHLDTNPINLEVQELIKHQRKKLRNRLAAQRCRKRKIEREDTLKAKVKELKQKNTDLTSLSRDLRMQVCELKQQVMQHVNQGCHVFLKDSEVDKIES